MTASSVISAFPPRFLSRAQRGRRRFRFDHGPQGPQRGAARKSPMPAACTLSGESQIVAILKEAESRIPVADLLRRHAVNKATFFKWRSYGASVSL